MRSLLFLAGTCCVSAVVLLNWLVGSLITHPLESQWVQRLEMVLIESTMSVIDGPPVARMESEELGEVYDSVPMTNTPK